MFGESRFSRSGRCGSFWQRGCGNFFAWFAGRTAPQCTPCDHSCWNVTNQKCNKPCGFRTNRTCDRTLNMVKMAAGHLPTSSHNFAWRGVINHDRTTKLTLQNKYDHTRPAGYPKVASPLEISFWIRNLFTHGQTLPGRFAIDSEAIDRRVDVVYRDVITGSRESRDHHYDARLIHRILKSLLPQNNTFFIATASVVKDTADNPDCQGLREQWYYLLFYVRRTIPPTVSPVNSPNKGQKAFMLSLICDWTNV